MSFTTRQFRDALGHFATGIAIVTAADAEGNVAGLTVNSFTSVSLEPPLLLVSLARNIASFALFERATYFAVSLLREEQRHVSAAFATSGQAKWQNAPHRIGAVKCPIIHPNLAAFECEVHARYDAGDHVLLLGQVIGVETTDSPLPRPLLYYRGQYRELSDEHIELAPFRLEGW
jgi:flavin reductase (DIM6/NTAB) family NADH-FMN oxidoreductase RutF